MPRCPEVDMFDVELLLCADGIRPAACPLALARVGCFPGAALAAEGAGPAAESASDSRVQTVRMIQYAPREKWATGREALLRAGGLQLVDHRPEHARWLAAGAASRCAS
jgi:hypothetical protein